MKKLNFAELNLSKEIQKAITDMGFEEASPIQSEAIPHLLEGKDVIGQAQTGTGKTVAFGIPALEKIDPKINKLQVLILCPTRELSIQVAEEIIKLSKYMKGVFVLPIYGGQSIDRQFQGLRRGPQIVIGTPGRVIDHLERKTLQLDNVKMFVLDEADEMLNMGFVEDIEHILETVPEDRQTVFFSATMPKQILGLTKKYQNNPEYVKVVHQELTVPNIEQLYFEVKDNNKLEALSRLIDVYNIKLGLVFCNTKRKVDELVEMLQARGYSADSIHGDMRQAQREQVMKRFKGGNIELLVATDVAARGIDVENIEAVFNYDIPYDEEAYVHRIGRTGRAGKNGRAFSFVSGRELYKIKEIQKYAKTKITLQRTPTLNEVEEMRISSYLEKIKNSVQEGQIEKYVHIIESFIEENEFTSMDIAATLLKMNLNLNEKAKSNVIDREPAENKKISGKMSRLFISLGRFDGVSPKDILGAIAGEANIPGKMVGGIDIYDKFSFVEIPEEYVNDVINAMNDNQIKGKKVNIEIAEENLKGGGDRDRGSSSERGGRGGFGGDRNRGSFGGDRDRGPRKPRNDGDEIFYDEGFLDKFSKPKKENAVGDEERTGGSSYFADKERSASSEPRKYERKDSFRDRPKKSFDDKPRRFSDKKDTFSDKPKFEKKEASSDGADFPTPEKKVRKKKEEPSFEFKPAKKLTVRSTVKKAKS